MSNGNEHQLQPVAQQALSTEASRSVEEVRASLMIAQQHPRNIERAMKRIEAECSQLGLAESAEYRYPRHDKGKRVEITGPSIRLLEVFMRHWGNLDAGWRELARWTDPKTGYEVVECEAYAWDMETNGRDRRRFSVLLARYFDNGGSKPVNDPRDQYELVANYAQRRKRACLEAMVPQWAIDQARELCKATIREKIQINADTIEGLIEAFGRFGVSKEQLEAYLDHPLTVADMTRREIIKLKSVYQALRDGEAKPRDFFPPAQQAAESNAGEDLTQQFAQHANGNNGQQEPRASAPELDPEGLNQGAPHPDTGSKGPDAHNNDDDGNGPPAESELFDTVAAVAAHPGKYSMDTINELAALEDAVSGARRKEYRQKLGEAREAIFAHQRSAQPNKPKPAAGGVQGAFFGD